jgi:hypothetical protein
MYNNNPNVMKKVVLLTALLVIGFLQVRSQSYVLSTVAGETIDSVTVGSRMSYMVDPDATISALSYMNPSVFKWAFSNALTINKENGTASTPVVTEPGYIVENAVSAIMPSGAGNFTLSVNEKSQPKAGTGCDGDIENLSITAFPRPTINFSGVQSNGSCAAASYNLPLVLTGYGPWTIEYSISFNAGAPVSYTIAGGNALTVGAVANKPGLIGTPAFSLSIPAAQLSGGVGEYNVVILNVYDRIALKSLDRALVGSIATDLPAANSYKLYIYPTPNTSPIKHIKNI